MTSSGNYFFGNRKIWPLRWAHSILVLKLCGQALGYDLSVPAPDKMLELADVIVIGRFQSPGGEIFVIDEKLKCPEFINGTIAVYSPHPDFAFPLAMFHNRIGGAPTILVGRWSNERRAVGATFGGSSFWPQGIPADGAPRGTLSELRLFIVQQLQQTVDATPTALREVERRTESTGVSSAKVGPAPIDYTTMSPALRLRDEPTQKTDGTRQNGTRRTMFVPDWWWIAISALFLMVALDIFRRKIRDK